MAAGLVALLLSTVFLYQVHGKPHIIIIMADDLGWNDVSFHGSSQIMTPNIDALAYKGVILNRHYTTATCSPSRASLLTGRYAAHTGIQRPLGAGSTTALPLNFTLLPQHLNQLGYRSHLVGKWHLGCHRSEYLPTRRGYHSHFGFWNGFVGYYDGLHVQGKAVGIDARRGDAEAWQEVAGHYLTDVFAEEAVSVIKSHEDAKVPLFLHVTLSAPHAGNPGQEFEVRDLESNEQQHSHIADIHRRLYAGMVRGVDDVVGAILGALRSKDMLNDSIVLFMSDNGAPTLDPVWSYHNYGSNWPLRGMKSSGHEGGMRGVAVLWSSQVPGGRVSDQLIHISDWLPTLYSAAGGRVEDLGVLDGVDQWRSLTSGDTQVPGPRTDMLLELDPGTGHEVMVRWPWKIVKYTSIAPALNIHAGESGRGPEVPGYRPSEVTASPAALALQLGLFESEVMVLRANATIEHRCPLVVGGNLSVRQCEGHYCLFNLETDPCETDDVAETNLPLVQELEDALELHRPTAFTSSKEVLDPRAHPSLWHNYWTTWADDAPSTATSPAPLLACLLLMLTHVMLST